MEITSKNLKETCAIAANLAHKAKPGDHFGLSGDLGSGKTAFVKCFARGLGIAEEITSPTFVVLKVYPFVHNFSEAKLVHVDAYRLESIKDAEAVGLLEFMADPSVIVVIEWPEKIFGSDNRNLKMINFEYLDEERRKINIHF